SLVRQTMFSLADQVVGSPSSSLVPRPPGPRNCIQSAPSAGAASRIPATSRRRGRIETPVGGLASPSPPSAGERGWGEGGFAYRVSPLTPRPLSPADGGEGRKKPHLKALLPFASPGAPATRVPRAIAARRGHRLPAFAAILAPRACRSTPGP